jgi:hypothetical protein
MPPKAVAPILKKRKAVANLAKAKEAKKKRRTLATKKKAEDALKYPLVTRF